jgi:hypothetical protein
VEIALGQRARLRGQTVAADGNESKNFKVT